MLIGDTKNPRKCIANAIMEMKIAHQVFRVTMESTLILEIATFNEPFPP